MPTYKLVIEYAGTRYSGWQKQKNALTVAGEIERAIATFTEGAFELGGAGRTDAGVHALAQVAHLRLEQDIAATELMRAINAQLPADINVLAADVTAPRFHARHHAVSRTYLYQISRRRTALAKRYVWWIDEPLDLDAMRRAASVCVGEHDFKLLCDRPQDQPSTQVRIDRVEVGEHGDLILIRFEASHYLWRMVRRITGALVQAGRGAVSESTIRELVAARAVDGVNAAEWTAPASGLFLERVRYSGDAPAETIAPAFTLRNR